MSPTSISHAIQSIGFLTDFRESQYVYPIVMATHLSSIALFGGLIAPATLGYAAAIWGIGIVVAVPLLGTCMVSALLALIWLESKVTGR